MFQKAPLIFQKIQQGELSFVKEFIYHAQIERKNVKYIQYFNHHFYDMLAAAVVTKQLPILQYLLNEQEFLHQTDIHFVLQLAVREGYIAILKELLQYSQVSYYLRANFQQYWLLANSHNHQEMAKFLKQFCQKIEIGRKEQPHRL